jgi:hypothetical protein
MFSDNANYGTIWALKDGNQAWGNIAMAPLGGNVGIGTSSPSSNSKLAVSNGGANGFEFDVVGASTELRSYNRSTSAYTDLSIIASNILFSNTGGERMRITSGGNLLVGTTSTIDNNRLTVLMNDATNGTGIAIRAVNDGGGGSQPALSYFNGSGNLIAKIVADNGTGFLGFNTGTSNTERMRITSGGNVGIGTTSPSTRLHIYQDNSNDVRLQLQQGTNDYACAINLVGNNDTGSSYNAILSRTGTNTAMWQIGGGGVANTMVMYTAGSERMRITAGGEVGIGTTSPGAKLQITESAVAWASIINHTNATDQFFMLFQYNGTNIGSIRGNNTSTAYNTTSDYRLKTDYKDFSGLDLLTKIKTYDYEWKSDKSRAYGVIAHELQSVINYAVTGVKDGKEMQGVDYSKIVPVLIKSIQELKQELDTLKNK